MATKTEAYKEALALSPTNRVNVDTFELSHPAVTFIGNDLYIIILIDVSGSMGPLIEDFAESLRLTVEGIENSQSFVNIFFSVATFEGVGTTTFLAGSNNRWINSTEAFNAIDLIETDGGDENGFGAIVEALNTVQFGQGLNTKRMMFLLTDEPSQSEGSTVEVALQTLQQKDCVFCQGYIDTNYGSLVAGTGGVFLNGDDPQADADSLVSLTDSFVFPDPEPPIFLTNDTQDHCFQIEDGTLTDFTSCGIRYTKPSPSSDGITSITFAIDNTDRKIFEYIKTIKDYPEPLRMRIRPYDYNVRTRTATLGVSQPTTVYLSNFVITATEVQATATFTDLQNAIFPRNEYTRRIFPL